MNDTALEDRVRVMLKDIADGTPISEPPTITTLRSGSPDDHRVEFGRTRTLTVVGIAACLLVGAVAIVSHQAGSTTTVSPAETAANETSPALTNPSGPPTPTNATESPVSSSSVAVVVPPSTPPVSSSPSGPQQHRYTIVAGDYLGNIAARMGTTVNGIVAANGWSDGPQHLIRLGDEIVIPADATPPTIIATPIGDAALTFPRIDVAGITPGTHPLRDVSGAHLSVSKELDQLCIAADTNGTTPGQLCGTGAAMIGSVLASTSTTRPILIIALAAGSRVNIDESSIPRCSLQYLTTPDIHGVDVWACEADLTTSITAWFTAPDGSTVLTSIPAIGQSLDPGPASSDSGPAATATTVAATSITNTVASTRTPTAADPARVLVVGDSEAGLLSPNLQTMIETSGLTALSTDYRNSSGLVRPDFFDWPTHLRQSIPAAKPDIVIAVFGLNDAQSFLSTDTQAGSAAGQAVDSPEWRAEYAKRVADVMNYLSADARTLIWVGVPNGTSDLIPRLAVQNDVIAAEAAKHPNIIFVDSWNHFIGIDGVSFAPYVLDPRDGQYKAVRDQTDPSHLNQIGQEILATYIDNALRQELQHRGVAIR
jgi:LysM repeat protein